MIQDLVDRLPKMATEAGVNGIVCSPLELVRLRKILPQSTTFVTPGIRPTGSAIGDQKRIMTPLEASNAGANFLVIGRPILTANNPEHVLFEIQSEMEK